MSDFGTNLFYNPPPPRRLLASSVKLAAPLPPKFSKAVRCPRRSPFDFIWPEFEHIDDKLDHQSGWNVGYNINPSTWHVPVSLEDEMTWFSLAAKLWDPEQSSLKIVQAVASFLKP